MRRTGNMAEIFRLNGLGLGDVEVKNRLQTCLDFVKEAEGVREYVAECIENANSLLTKWFYKNNMKSVTDTYTTSATITARLTGEGDKFQKQLESTSVQDRPCHDELHRKTPGRENNKGNDATSF